MRVRGRRRERERRKGIERGSCTQEKEEAAQQKEGEEVKEKAKEEGEDIVEERNGPRAKDTTETQPDTLPNTTTQKILTKHFNPSQGKKGRCA